MSEQREMYPIKETEHVGKLLFANERGQFSHCAIKYFPDAKGVGDFFKQPGNDSLMIVEMQPHQDGGLTVIYTRTISDEELREMALFNQAWLEEKAKRLAVELEAEEKAEEERKAAEAEANRLRIVGRKCEEHHRPVIEENQKLRAEIKKLRKGKE